MARRGFAKAPPTGPQAITSLPTAGAQNVEPATDVFPGGLQLDPLIEQIAVTAHGFCARQLCQFPAPECMRGFHCSVPGKTHPPHFVFLRKNLLCCAGSNKISEPFESK